MFRVLAPAACLWVLAVLRISSMIRNKRHGVFAMQWMRCWCESFGNVCGFHWFIIVNPLFPVNHGAVFISQWPHCFISFGRDIINKLGVLKCHTLGLLVKLKWCGTAGCTAEFRPKYCDYRKGRFVKPYPLLFSNTFGDVQVDWTQKFRSFESQVWWSF